MQKIILCGKTSSGKTELSKILTFLGLKKEVACTTRPPRPNERDGDDYHFLTKREFKSRIKKGEFLEHTSFNGWYYGKLHSEVEESNVMIATPVGIQTLIDKLGRENVYIVYLDAPDTLIEERLVARGDDSTELHRRIASDAKDFELFETYDLCLDIHHDYTMEHLQKDAMLLYGMHTLQKITEFSHTLNYTFVPTA